MLGSIGSFEEILKNIDRKMRKEKRKIIMFVDNCGPHLTDEKYENIKLILLPPNTTSILQPLDQGIIHSFKSYYRKNLISHMISLIEKRNEINEEVGESILWKKNDEFNLLQSMILMKSALEHVTSTTITNCFRKAHFDFPIIPTTSIICEEDEYSYWDQLKNVHEIDYNSFDEYNAIDNELPCSGLLTDEEIIKSSKEGEEDGEQNEEKEEEEIIIPNVTSYDAYKSVQNLFNFFSKIEDEDAFEKLISIQNKISKYQSQHQKQSEITDFFNAK
jgi:hypothetical protein